MNINDDVDAWKEKMDEKIDRHLAVAWPTAQEPVVLALQQVATSLDEVESTVPVTARMEHMTPPPKLNDNVKYSEFTPATDIPMPHEWVNWRWSRVAAFAFSRMSFDELTEEVDKIRSAIDKFRSEHPELQQPETADYRGFNEWAKRNKNGQAL